MSPSPAVPTILSVHRAALFVFCLVGCQGQTAYQPNEVEMLLAELTPAESAEVRNAIDWLFGGPDAPRVPEALPVDAALVNRAAGRAATQQVGHNEGLFRQHCVRCHGVTGDGRGPAAFYQNPYPRDFRRGTFKWKRTYRGQPPTREDLHAVLKRGVPGSAMPSFALLQKEERDALVEYVRFLSMRGQTESALIRIAVELEGEDSKESMLDPENSPAHSRLCEDLVERVAERWRDANLDVLTPTEVPSPSPESVRRGGELFVSRRAGCAACHNGPPPNGAFENDYDDWNKQVFLLSERTARLRRQGPRAELLEAHLRALTNSMPPRPAVPRSLPGSDLRFAADRVDLFRSISQGIAGTTMPAVGPPSPSDQLGPPAQGALTPQQVWDLVDYLLADRSQQITETLRSL